MQSEMLRQIGRAAAQGLLEANLPEPFHEPMPTGLGESMVEPSETHQEEPAAQAHINIHIENSVDREFARLLPKGTSPEDGKVCIGSDLVNVVEWGDEDTVWEQISRQRRKLSGEFDKANPVAAEALAKAYIYAGFGAEALQIIDSFDFDPETALILKDLALIIDGLSPRQNGVLRGQTACDTEVALWAVLALSKLSKGTDVNRPRVIATFSELPLHLRRYLGPKLAEMFLEIGDIETATAIRNAIARAPGDAGDEFRLMEAHFEGSVASLVEIRGRRNLRVHRSHPTGGWNRQGDHAMTKNTATSTSALLANEAGYDPIEDRLRQNIRATIEAVFEEELEQFLGRCRYGRSGGAKAGYRHGHRERQLVGTFGTETVRVPRARITGEAGKAREWRSKALPRYQRLTKKAEALIAAVYLSGTNTRRVKRALFGLFQGAVSKDVVSRAWRKVKVDWQAWCARSLADEDIVRLILDGTVIKTRIDRKATNISVLAAIGVRRDGQKVLLSLMNMGGESTSAWRQFINDLDARGLKRPEFVIVDGAPGLEVALIALWGEDLPIQRCTVHKHRNLLAKAPKRMHDELTEDYRDMIYAKTPEEIATRRKAFLRKWRLKCKAVADSLEEAGDKLFTFTRLPQGQWKSARTTNAIERLNEEFRRRIKTQTVLPCAETVPMLLWALMASGQIVMRKVDGWETLAQPVADATLDQAA